MINGLRKYIKKSDDNSKAEVKTLDEFEVFDEETQGPRYSAEEFYATVDQRFIAILSNGNEIELC